MIILGNLFVFFMLHRSLRLCSIKFICYSEASVYLKMKACFRIRDKLYLNSPSTRSCLVFKFENGISSH